MLKKSLFWAVATALITTTSSFAQEQFEDGEITYPERPKAELAAWLAYSTAFGATAGGRGAFFLSDSDDTELNIQAEVSDQRYRLGVGYSKLNAFDTNARLDFDVTGVRLTARPQLQFETETLAIQAQMNWEQSEGQSLAAYVGFSKNRLSNPRATLTNFLTPDLSDYQRGVVGLSYASVKQTENISIRYGGFAEYASISGGRQQFKFGANAFFAGPLFSDQFRWSLDTRGGVLSTQGGASSIGERFILGGGSLRGFAYGGFGPSDGTQTLGGNQFAVARLDVRMLNAFGQGTRFVPGVHVDVGSLWGLDQTTVGGVTVDDRSRLYGSVGLTMAVRTDFGLLSASLSQPLSSGGFQDVLSARRQQLQISFNTTF